MQKCQPLTIANKLRTDSESLSTDVEAQIAHVVCTGFGGGVVCMVTRPPVLYKGPSIRLACFLRIVLGTLSIIFKTISSCFKSIFFNRASFRIFGLSFICFNLKTQGLFWYSSPPPPQCFFSDPRHHLESFMSTRDYSVHLTYNQGLMN